ncbi:MAG: DUF885 family protein [Pseudomonadota bacterium]
MKPIKTPVAVLFAALAFSMGNFAAASDYRDLTDLFSKWRGFEPPTVEACVPDYSAEAMAAKAEGLAAFQKDLGDIDVDGWSVAQRNDLKIVEAEMNGMDFDLRVLKPFARDPSFYANVFADQSDVPEHEGPSAYPAIDLYTFQYPLSEDDDAKLTCLIGAIPAILDQAKVNLADSNARGLWVYGTRAFREQSVTLTAFAAGTLKMRTLEGMVEGNLEGASPALLDAIARAKSATDTFRQWLEDEAPSKSGPSGVGKEHYDWYMKNVLLSPYGWREQVTLLRRELDRARAALAIEEFRNRDLKPLEPFNDPDAYMAMATAKMDALADFLIEGGLVEDKDYYRDALAQQIGGYTPPENRNFFSNSAAHDPTPLYSHFYHWIELAARKHEPNESPVRAATPLYDMYDGRAEGLATAMEEVLMHAGLYDETPRGREVVWVLAANRAARGLASLYVHSNEWTLEDAGQFHARWTPLGWTDPESDLVAFEQLLYLRQPGYGTSYITGKLELDRLISNFAFDREQEGKAFSLPEFFKALNEADVIPFSLIEEEMTKDPLRIEDARR